MRLRRALRSPFLGPRASRTLLISHATPASAQVPQLGRCRSPGSWNVSTRSNLTAAYPNVAGYWGRRSHLHRNLRLRHSSQADPGCCLGWLGKPSALPMLPVRRDAGIGTYRGVADGGGCRCGCEGRERRWNRTPTRSCYGMWSEAEVLFIKVMVAVVRAAEASSSSGRFSRAPQGEFGRAGGLGVEGEARRYLALEAGVTSRLTWEGGEGRKGRNGVDLSTREPPRLPSPTF
jgi:hypothetical protein